MNDIIEKIAHVDTINIPKWVPVVDSRNKDKERIKNTFKETASVNSELAREKDIRYFENWVKAVYGFTEIIYPIPVDVVGKFITDHFYGLDPSIEIILVDEGSKKEFGIHKVKTIQRRLSIISKYHDFLKIPTEYNPCRNKLIKELIKKLRLLETQNGIRPDKKKAIDCSILGQLIKTCDQETLIDIRDAALMMFAFSTGGRRRSEVANAKFSDLIPVGQHFLYYLPFHKTNKSGVGDELPLRGFAADKMKLWLAHSHIYDGYLFRRITKHGIMAKEGLSGKAVSNIVKKRIKLAGLNPQEFGGHSFRHGFLTEVKKRGLTIEEGMQLSLHKDRNTANGYVKQQDILSCKAAQLADILYSRI